MPVASVTQHCTTLNAANATPTNVPPWLLTFTERITKLAEPWGALPRGCPRGSVVSTGAQTICPSERKKNAKAQTDSDLKRSFENTTFIQVQ